MWVDANLTLCDSFLCFSHRKIPGFEKFKPFYLMETSLLSFGKEVILKVGDTYICKINVA